MRDQRRAVLDLAASAVNGGHAEPHSLTFLVTIGQNAVVGGIGAIEQGDVAPDHELTRRVAGLSRWWRRGLLGLRRGGSLRRLAENGHRRKNHQHKSC